MHKEHTVTNHNFLFFSAKKKFELGWNDPHHNRLLNVALYTIWREPFVGRRSPCRERSRRVSLGWELVLRSLLPPTSSITILTTERWATVVRPIRSRGKTMTVSRCSECLSRSNRRSLKRERRSGLSIIWKLIKSHAIRVCLIWQGSSVD
jgi:hypothetical protein